ncbi:DUF485 domain-containing protein [Streptomyces sp. NPDC001288]|uniref:DUF485 domain-containing protein n=1 Tax=Streptomyces sp. NPDC001297 TaxID=3364559 RepID=UPI0036951754
MSHHSPPGTHGWQVFAEPAFRQHVSEILEHRDELRRSHRSHRSRGARRLRRRAAAVAVFGCFTLFLVMLLSACIPGLLARTVADGIPAGLLLALLQPPAIVLAVALHENAAERPVEATTDHVREQAEPDPWQGVLP